MTSFLLLAVALKVLTIGNSFSIQMEKEMPPIAANLGLDLDICSLYIGGCQFERHWKNINAPTSTPYTVTRTIGGRRVYGDWKKKGNIPEWLKAEKWDVVTIQQASPFSWHAESYQPFADNVIQTIRELAPQAEIVVHETWSYKSDDPLLAKWGVSQETMYGKLHAAYAELAAKHKFRIIPTGTAAERFPNRDCLFKDIHFNKLGNHFQALVWTATLFGADVTRCTYVPEGVPADLAKTMRKVARETALGFVPRLNVSFARGQWNAADFIPVKSPRLDYLGVFDQREDCIVNRCPDGLTPEELFKHHNQKVYSAIVHRQRVGLNATISSKMGWDWRMAPIIVLAPGLDVTAKGERRLGEHWEVCLYDRGINLWHHFFRDGKPRYDKAASIDLPERDWYRKDVAHDLKVRVFRNANNHKEIVVTCGDFSFNHVDDELPDTFYAGVIGCEGRNFFWDFKVNEK